MILTNSELPVTMLDKNLELNQYDFVLFHLMLSNKEYRDYYFAMRKIHPERLMILDNSGYEFFIKNQKLDVDAYKKLIKELKPDYFILPDILMDKDATIDKTIRFLVHEYENTWHAKPIAVIQGNTPHEMYQCLTTYHLTGIKNIAIPFHNSFFKHYFGDFDLCFQAKYGVKETSEDMKYAVGRIAFIKNHLANLRGFEYIHLLGSHCPYEKALIQRNFDINIKSMDTGYPVKCAIEGYELFKEPKKPEIIIDDFMEDHLDDSVKELIIKNVTMFKEL